jgi:hypothetical protein
VVGLASSKHCDVFLVAGHTWGKPSDWPTGTNIPCMEKECVSLLGQCPHHYPMPPAGVRCHDIHTAVTGLCVSCLLLLYLVTWWDLGLSRWWGFWDVVLCSLVGSISEEPPAMMIWSFAQYWYLLYHTTWHHILEDHFVKLRIILLEYFLKCSFDRNGGTSELQSRDTSFVSVTCLRSC